jgi:pilus assembly protein CpaE
MKVLLVGVDRQLEKHLRAVLTETDVFMTWGVDGADYTQQQLTEELVRAAGDLVVLGSSAPLGRSLRLAAALDEACPQVPVLLEAEPSAEVWEQSLRSGVRGVIAEGSDVEGMRPVVERAVEVATRRRVTMGDVLSAASKVITVTSAKGGAGKTTLATNLAVGLAAVNPGQVVLVDLDMQFGDVVTSLSLSPEADVTDAVTDGQVVDSRSLKAFLTPHDSGLFVLCAPDDPVMADAVKPSDVSQIMELLATMFAFVIVDTSAGVDEIALAAMDQSTELYLLTSTDVPAVNALRKEVQALHLIELDRIPWKLILNRADAKVGIELSDIEVTIGMPIEVKLPSTRTVPISLNQGRPIISDQPRSPYSRALMPLVEELAFPDDDSKATRRRLRDALAAGRQS